MSARPFIEVPAYQDILQYTAEFIFKNYADAAAGLSPALPPGSSSIDLSSVYVLLPNAQAVEQFNPTLSLAIPEKTAAIIPPWSGSLKQWAITFIDNPQPDYEIINNHARRLLFIEALQKHPTLFKEENQWQVTSALLDLFDDLNLNQKQLFNSAEEWQEQLQQAYGLSEPHQHLLYESKLVFTLWHAWQQQLDDSKLIDETADYIARLKNAETALSQQCQFFCVGYSQYSRTEQEFIQSLIDKGLCQTIDYESDYRSEYSSDFGVNKDHTFSNFIHQAFTPSSISLKLRAEDFARQQKDTSQHTAKTALPFSTYLATNEEEQVRAIDFFVRSNLLDGKNNIAVISEDRKLSRRLRALLERANVQLNDKAGWSLATTQASTIVERWLECIEEDFSAFPLLDCLKSPFVNIADDTISSADFQKNIYRLEHDIIFHENVSSNIDEYKKQLRKRLKRLTHWPQNSYNELINTLNFIQERSKNLSALYHAGKKIHLSEFLNTLLNSLEKLGVLTRYQNDDAGLRLLETFEHLKHSLSHADPVLSWHDCRIWLGLALENEHFTPTVTHSPVQLMTLEQAAYLTFDCIIIAATEAQHFPGGPNSSPFFNQAVRASLELSTWEKQNQLRQDLFKQTLLSAPTILLTACGEENGEEKPVSPWLELLINFYQLAFNEDTENKKTAGLVRSKSSVSSCGLASDRVNVENYDENTFPIETAQASSALPFDLIPERVSASAYQRLINCPYQYFSADGLQLKPLEEISEELKKADYGERIHLILQCFHNGHDKFGEAYSHAITHESKTQAEEFLSALSEKVFLRDLEDNVLHRSWLYRWQKHIPAYINWQIKQQADWRIYQSEENLEVDLLDAGLATTDNANDDPPGNIKIYGRLDRIDKNKHDTSHAIIDYKTGKCANQEDVDTGENVQLSTYALLDKEASVVSYLSLDSSNQKVETKSFLSADELDLNRKLNKQRLIELFNQLQKQETLPAWGDDNVCRFCKFSGLCRKQEWAT